MMNNDIYIASDGKPYDIKTLNTERLINSLAKHHRDIYASNSDEEFKFHSNQIAIIEEDLLRRNAEFRDKKKGGGLWT